MQKFSCIPGDPHASLCPNFPHSRLASLAGPTLATWENCILGMRMHPCLDSCFQVPKALVEELATLLRERAKSLVTSEDGSKARRKEVRGLDASASLSDLATLHCRFRNHLTSTESSTHHHSSRVSRCMALLALVLNRRSHCAFCSSSSVFAAFCFLLSAFCFLLAKPRAWRVLFTSLCNDPALSRLQPLPDQQEVVAQLEARSLYAAPFPFDAGLDQLQVS